VGTDVADLPANNGEVVRRLLFVRRSAIPPIKGELQMLRPLLLSLMLFVAGSFSAAADPKQEAENLVKTYEANFNKKDAAGIAACTPRTASELPIGAC
jgi:hypothetical protein